jgi:2-methylisocitrate lyase-like PEP mutase family enzyme
MGSKGATLSLAELRALGVKRISVGSAMYRAAVEAFMGAAREMRERGTFGFAVDAISYGELNGLMSSPPAP